MSETMQLITDDAPAMPTGTRPASEQSGVYVDLLRPVIALRDPETGIAPAKVTVFPAGMSEDDVDSFRKGFTHAANNLDVGATTVVKRAAKTDAGWVPAEDGTNLAMFWQVRPKRVRVAPSGTSTPGTPAAPDSSAAPAAADESGADPTPANGKAKAKA